MFPHKVLSFIVISLFTISGFTSAGVCSLLFNLAGSDSIKRPLREGDVVYVDLSKKPYATDDPAQRRFTPTKVTAAAAVGDSVGVGAPRVKTVDGRHEDVVAVVASLPSIESIAGGGQTQATSPANISTFDKSGKELPLLLRDDFKNPRGVAYGNPKPKEQLNEIETLLAKKLRLEQPIFLNSVRNLIKFWRHFYNAREEMLSRGDDVILRNSYLSANSSFNRLVDKFPGKAEFIELEYMVENKHGNKADIIHAKNKIIQELHDPSGSSLYLYVKVLYENYEYFKNLRFLDRVESVPVEQLTKFYQQLQQADLEPQQYTPVPQDLSKAKLSVLMPDSPEGPGLLQQLSGVATQVANRKRGEPRLILGVSFEDFMKEFGSDAVAVEKRLNKLVEEELNLLEGDLKSSANEKQDRDYSERQKFENFLFAIESLMDNRGAYGSALLTKKELNFLLMALQNSLAQPGRLQWFRECKDNAFFENLSRKFDDKRLNELAKIIEANENAKNLQSAVARLSGDLFKQLVNAIENVEQELVMLHLEYFEQQKIDGVEFSTRREKLVSKLLRFVRRDQDGVVFDGFYYPGSGSLFDAFKEIIVANPGSFPRLREYFYSSNKHTQEVNELGIMNFSSLLTKMSNGDQNAKQLLGLRMAVNVSSPDHVAETKRQDADALIRFREELEKAERLDFLMKEAYSALYDDTEFFEQVRKADAGDAEAKAKATQILRERVRVLDELAEAEANEAGSAGTGVGVGVSPLRLFEHTDIQ